jgi:hypothetical protein
MFTGIYWHRPVINVKSRITRMMPRWPLWSIPLSHDPVAGVSLLSGVDARRHLMGSDEEQVDQSNNAQ